MTSRSQQASAARAWRVWAVALCMALLGVACGGEDGVGSGGTGIVVGFGEGTVTALASATSPTIDGAGFDASQASLQVEVTPGIWAATALELGQHVEFDFKQDRVANAVRIEPQVIGPVEAIGIGSFTVLGQRVLANAVAAIGPLTVFEGYTSIADVQLGQWVEVHGLAQRDSTGTYGIQATRIERLASAQTFARVTGVVSQVSRSALDNSTRFKVGTLNVAVPSGTARAADVSALVAGQTVVVFGSRSAVSDTFEAVSLRTRQRENAGIAAYFGGTLAQISGTSGFELNGVPLRLDAVTASGYVPADQQYVQFRGNFAVDGSLDVSAASVRGNAGEFEIEGPVSQLDATQQVALVRGFIVRFGNARIENCPNGVRVGSAVEVRGTVVAGEVIASRLKCDD